jgi:hypothetical protein
MAQLLNEERRETMRAHRDEVRELKIEVAKLPPNWPHFATTSPPNAVVLLVLSR